MLLTLLAAAAVQFAAQAAPSPQAALPQRMPPQAAISGTATPNPRRLLACQQTMPAPMLVGSPGASAGPHILAAEPDAHMLRPVVRQNFCKDSDVVRSFVSSKEAPKKAQEPESTNPRSPAHP